MAVALGDLSVAVAQYALDFVQRPATVNEEGRELVTQVSYMGVLEIHYVSLHFEDSKF